MGRMLNVLCPQGDIQLGPSSRGRVWLNELLKKKQHKHIWTTSNKRQKAMQRIVRSSLIDEGDALNFIRLSFRRLDYQVNLVGNYK